MVIYARMEISVSTDIWYLDFTDISVDIFT